MRPTTPARASGLAAAAALTLFGAAAQAQEPSADLRGLRMPLSPAGGLEVDPVASPGTGESHLGVRMGYAYRAIELRDAAGETVLVPLEHQLTGEALLGVGLFERVTLAIDLPVVIAQTGDDSRTDARAARLVEPGGPPLSALGDPGLAVKLTLLTPEVDGRGSSRGLGLALTDRFTFPLGDERGFLGEGHVTNDARLWAELGLGALTAHLGAGAKLRGDEGTFACDPASTEPCGARFGHELRFAGGVALHPEALGLDDEGRTSFFLESFGWLPLSPVAPFDSSAAAGWFVSGAGRYRFGDFAVLGGAAFAVNDGVGNAPVRVTLGLEFAPRGRDEDGDGIGDEVDACPADPEDFDLFEDRDGCPELDNDGDRVPDALDACPDREGTPEARGCAGLAD